MARTNIQVFNAGYQNIMDDDNYNVNVQRTRGVTAGIADPLLHNKLYRQTSIMAKALADYIVSQGQDCLDTDLNAITNAFTKALETHTRKNTGVLVTESKTAVNTADWNTLIESRTYKITGATFAADKHQPVGAIGTGELVVLKNGDDTIVQVYYANSTEFDKAGAYHRVNIGGTWTDWVYNITNKGGTVTGDFDINGKLTVDTIEVSNSLTIGGAPPLGQDAIDKIQAQIIAPSQTIYIDQKNGNDNNDGTSRVNAVETFDKAITLMKKNTTAITFAFCTYTEEEDLVYNKFYVSKQIPDVGQTKTIFIRSTLISPSYNDYTFAEIVVPYGSFLTGSYYQSDMSRPLKVWGNFLMINPKNVECTMVKFTFPSSASEDTTKFINAVFVNLSENLYLNGSGELKEDGESVFEAGPNKCLMLILNKNITNVKFYRTILTGTDYLIRARYPKYIYYEDPKNEDAIAVESNYSVNSFISQYILLQYKMSEEIKKNGLADEVIAIYSNVS